jgi:hypothetical protein
MKPFLNEYIGFSKELAVGKAVLVTTLGFNGKKHEQYFLIKKNCKSHLELVDHRGDCEEIQFEDYIDEKQDMQIHLIQFKEDRQTVMEKLSKYTNR